ncbi:hypothetical protein [Mycobacterium sp.]|nr:hypothetical protein [Mycobacterium sp.]HKP42099.1 hypothetical protein [Mycobacterium sp.]
MLVPPPKYLSGSPSPSVAFSVPVIVPSDLGVDFVGAVSADGSDGTDG